MTPDQAPPGGALSTAPAIPGNSPNPGAPIASISAHDRKRDNPSIHDLDPKTMDPDRHYRWVYRGGEGIRIARAKLRGFRVEKIKQGGVQPIAEIDKTGDGAIVIGDTVLMSRPKTRHDAARQKLFNQNEARLAATTAELERKAREILPQGVQLITDPDSRGEWRDHA